MCALTPASPSALSTPARSSPTTVLVCVSCRGDGDAESGPRAGARLAADLARLAEGCDDLRVMPVACLSVCRRPVTVGFAAPGKWTYLSGDNPADAAVEILAAARLHGAAADGIVPWKSRPTALRKGLVARIPPLDPPPESVR